MIRRVKLLKNFCGCMLDRFERIICQDAYKWCLLAVYRTRFECCSYIDAFLNLRHFICSVNPPCVMHAVVEMQNTFQREDMIHRERTCTRLSLD